MKKIKWGVLGCGGIAEKFCASLKRVKDGELLACASRTPGKAKSFAGKHGASLYFDSYETMLQEANVDIVYVATTHNFHFENVMQVLNAGKAVLCEKPITVNADEATQIYKQAKESELFVMEGMWTRFLPAILQVKEWIDAGKIGEIKVIRADFCFNVPFQAESRLYKPDLAGGSLLDAGIYPVSMASYLMDGEQPALVEALASLAKTGVDDQVVATFRYESGALAVVTSGISAASENRLEISGSQGRIEVPNGFLGADRAELHPQDGKPEYFQQSYLPETGFLYEIQAVHEALRSKETQCSKMGWQESIAIMETMDRVQSSFNR